MSFAVDCGVWKSTAGGSFRCCQGCALRTSWTTKQLIREGLEAGRPGSFVGFLTFTEGAEPRSLKEHGQAVGRAMEDVTRLLGGTSKQHPYLGVRELQQRGAWHTHLLVHGWTRIDLAVLRGIAVRHGLGERVNVKAIPLGSQQAMSDLAQYLVKSFGRYLTKGVSNAEDYSALCAALPKGARLVVHSKSWANGRTAGAIRSERLAAWRSKRDAEVATADRDFRLAVMALEAGHLIGLPEIAGERDLWPVVDPQLVLYDP